jgi:hypothetical protein
MHQVTPHDQVCERITIAMMEIARRRIQYEGEAGFYEDDEESRKRYYFPTLEGLEALLIPALAIDGSWVYLATEKPKIKAAISHDIEYVLSFNSSSQSKQNKQGQPYFFTGRGASKKHFWISECGAFTLSTLINVLTLSETFPDYAPTFDHSKLRAAIKLNVNNLLQCSVSSGGWSWSKNGNSPDSWATWSVIETLTDYLTYEKDYGISLPSSRRVKESLGNAARYLKSQLDWGSEETISGKWYKSVFKKGSMKTPNQVQCGYSFVHTMISASLLGLQGLKTFRELATMLFQSVESVDVKSVENLARVSSKNKEIDDYSYHPTLLRALTSIYVQMGPKNRKRLAEELPKAPSFYVRAQFDRLMKRYKRQGEWAGLWGHNNQYEIYFTERSLEALVSLAEFLAQTKESEPWEMPSAIVESEMDELRAELRNMRKKSPLK